MGRACRVPPQGIGLHLWIEEGTEGPLSKARSPAPHTLHLARH